MPAERIEAYDGAPAAGIRRILTERTTEGIGDPALMATAMRLPQNLARPGT